MINEINIREILLKIVNDNIKEWTKKPKFDVVFDSYGCAIVAIIDDEKRLQVVAFKRSELDDYLMGSRHQVENKIGAKLLLVQRKFSY